MDIFSKTRTMNHGTRRLVLLDCRGTHLFPYHQSLLLHLRLHGHDLRSLYLHDLLDLTRVAHLDHVLLVLRVHHDHVLESKSQREINK
jgi:hypothetical protein